MLPWPGPSCCSDPRTVCSTSHVLYSIALSAVGCVQKASSLSPEDLFVFLSSLSLKILQVENIRQCSNPMLDTLWPFSTSSPCSKSNVKVWSKCYLLEFRWPVVTFPPPTAQWRCSWQVGGWVARFLFLWCFTALWLWSPVNLASRDGTEGEDTSRLRHVCPEVMYSASCGVSGSEKWSQYPT